MGEQLAFCQALLEPGTGVLECFFLSCALGCAIGYSHDRGREESVRDVFDQDLIEPSSSHDKTEKLPTKVAHSLLVGCGGGI